MKSVLFIALLVVLAISVVVEKGVAKGVEKQNQNLQEQFQKFLSGTYDDPRLELYETTENAVIKLMRQIEDAVDQLLKTNKTVLESGVKNTLKFIKAIRTKLETIQQSTEIGSYSKQFFLNMMNILVQYLNDVLNRIEGKPTKTITEDVVLNFLKLSFLTVFSIKDRIVHDDKQLALENEQEVSDMSAIVLDEVKKLESVMQTTMGKEIVNAFEKILIKLNEFAEIKMKTIKDQL